MLPCPAAGRGGGGSPWGGGKLFQARLSLLGGTMQGRDPPTQEGSAGEGLEGLARTPAYPLHVLHRQAPSALHPAAPPNPPSVPVPLHTLCLRRG